jgi:hypothetical protein
MFNVCHGEQCRCAYVNGDAHLIHRLNAILQDDELTRDEIGVLVDTFPGQPLDFFGAIRCGRATMAFNCSYMYWLHT